MPTILEQKYIDRYLDTMYPKPVAEPKFGRGGVTAKQSEAAGGLEVPAKAMLDMGAATVKGATQGFLGLPGDLESLSYGVKEIFNRGGDEEMLDAFLRGMNEKTIMPNTEEVKAWLDKNVGMVNEGKNPYESIGEFAAPGGYIKAAKAAGKVAATGVKKAATELAPNAAAMAEKQLRKTGMIMDIVPPRVDSIDRFPLGPTSIKPKVIAQDVPLHREMNADNLTSFLRDDKQFTYSPTFVTDNADLAIGQGSNKGVKVTFRANSVSGEEHKKPMTGTISGREYKADVFAPKAIESISFDTEADLKKVRGFAANTLRTEFERMTNDKTNIVFVRKSQATQENK